MDSFFYGRKDIFSLIRKRVCDLKEGYRQNVALIGSRHVGKSSIFIKYLSDLDDSLVIPVYLDLENRDYYFFLSKFIRSILYNFAKTKKMSLSDDLVALLDMAEPIIPQTVSRARLAISLAEQAKVSESYDVILSLPEIFTQETNLFCVIVLDEFQVLEEFNVPNVFSRLADRITTQKGCLYIIASSFEDMALRILSQKLTLLFGSFEVVNVMPFDLLQSQDLIAARLGQIKIGLQLKNFLADFTGGRPLYLDILIQELINLSSVYKQQEIYAPLVVQSIENLVFSRWGALSRHFELAINQFGGSKSHRLVQEIIFALAEGRCRHSELCEMLKVKPALLIQKLNILIDEDMVAKNGSHFHLKDKMFRYWVKYVFLRRIRSIEMEPGRLKKDFKEEIIRSINDFNMVCRKDLSARVTDLLHCFDDDLLSLSGRKYRLPMFKHIQLLRLRQRAGFFCDVLKAEADEGTWLIILRKESMSETDVNTVMEEALSLGLKPRKCVIISMGPLDDSSRLRAMEKRIWIWSEPEINSLMNIFDKPYIVP